MNVNFSQFIAIKEKQKTYGPVWLLVRQIGWWSPLSDFQGPLNHQFYWYILAMYPINPNHIFYSVKVHPWFSSYGIASPS